MFCPKCKAEYREGFTECADCGVVLVKELPPEDELEYLEYEEVLATYNAVDIAMVTSLMEKEDLTYYFKGEHFHGLRPLAEPVRLMVLKDQAQRARELLEDLDLRFVAISINPDSGTDDPSGSPGEPS